MASRYGRKKRAEHRRVIADLTRRLERESTAHMYLPGEDVPDLESCAQVSEWSVSEDGSLMGVVYRNATVVVEGLVPELMELVYNQTRVQFRGTQYLIENVNHRQWAAQVELNLIGVM